MTYIDNLVAEYKELLETFVFGNEKDRDRVIEDCHKFTDSIIELDTSPEELVALHKELINDLNIDDVDQIKCSLELLHEMMIGFGFIYRDYKSMLNVMEVHDKEMNVAAKLQETMLKTEIPSLKTIEVGALSVPAHKVSGDYFNIIDHKDGIISFAIADVIGKGIPAAIAMSMIKFGMDSYSYSQLPSDSLRKLNRVVEKNVNQNMFITMFYGLYDKSTQSLYYSSAGHEPALVYRYDLDEFEEIDAKGIVLGVKKYTHYEQKETFLGENDMFIGYTDGVSELRKNDGSFIKLEEIMNLIREVKDHHPQDIVQYIYERLIKVQNINKKDDLTMLILKKNKNIKK